MKRRWIAALLALALCGSVVAAAFVQVARASGARLSAPTTASELAQELLDPANFADAEGPFEDANFALAVAQSMLDNPNIFLNGISLDDFGSYEELLNNYNGTINASGDGKPGGEKIADITGIHYLKSAREIILSNNLIEDLTPVRAPSTVEDYSSYYNSTPNDPRRRGNVRLDVTGNRLHVFPEDMGGALDFAGNGMSTVIYPVVDFSFVATGGVPSFDVPYTMDDIQLDGNMVELISGSFLDGADNLRYSASGFEFDGEDVPAMGGKLEQTGNAFLISGVNRNGRGFIETGMDGSYQFSYWTSGGGTVVTIQSKTIKFVAPISVEIYNTLALNQVNKIAGSLIFTKTNTFTSDTDKKALAGAEYTLTQGGSVIGGALVTGPDGTFQLPAEVLQGGTFTLTETKAPEGYELDGTPLEFTVTPGGVSVDYNGNVVQSVTPNDGSGAQAEQSYTDNTEGAFVLGGAQVDYSGAPLTGGISADVNLNLTLPTLTIGGAQTSGSLVSITVTRTQGNSITLTGDETQTFTVGSGYADADAVLAAAETYAETAFSEYANVTVSAGFDLTGALSQTNKRLPVTVDLEAEKEVDGRANDLPTFSFGLGFNPATGYTGTAALTDSDVQVETAAGTFVNLNSTEGQGAATVRNTPTGEIAFPTIQLYQPGTYTFTLTEIGGTGGVVTVDGVDYAMAMDTVTATVEVTEDPTTGRLLVSTPTYEDETGTAGNTFRNRELVDVTATKTWSDSADPSRRPASVTFTLSAGGAAITADHRGPQATPAGAAITLDGTADSDGETGAWTATWSNLYKYDAAGTLIVYTVAETSGLTDYVSRVTMDGGNSYRFTVNNILAGVSEITGTKTWNDNSDAAGRRPDDITLRVTATPALDGVGASEVITLQTTNPAGDNYLEWDKITNPDVWTYTIDNLTAYTTDGSQPIAYSVEEVLSADSPYILVASGSDFTNILASLGGFTKTVHDGGDTSNDGDTFSFLLEYDQGGGTWTAYSGTYWVYSASAGSWSSHTTAAGEITGVQDGDTVVFTQLPKETDYRVTEQTASGYIVPSAPITGRTVLANGLVTVDAAGNVMPEPGAIRAVADNEFVNVVAIEVPVEKVWVEGGIVVTSPTHLPAGITSVTVTLLENGVPTSQTLTLDEAVGWRGAFTGLPAYDPTGARIAYTVEETEIEGYVPGYTANPNGGLTITNFYTNWLMIDNVLPRPNDTTKTDLGGFVELAGVEDRDERPYKEQERQVSWWPDEYWSHADSFVVNYFDTDQQMKDNTPARSVTVNIPKQPNGRVNVAALKAELEDKLPGVTVTVGADQRITLTLAPAAILMDFATQVEVHFVPSLLIENVQLNDDGGKVSLEGGTLNNVEDGRQDEQTHAFGQADEGWRVDTDEIGIKHPSSHRYETIWPDADGKFTMTVEDPNAGETTVTGRVEYQYDADGNVTRVDVYLDDLPTSLDVSVSFEEIPSTPVEPSDPSVEPSTPPVEPSTPPVEPSDPPVEPSTPPVEPSTPPVEPSDPPVEPSDPSVEPSTPPVEPSTPPVEPSDPPVEPSDPSVEPSDPSEPSPPVESNDPNNPGEPGDPSDPNVPVNPNDPNNPGTPGNEGDPSDPSVPVVDPGTPQTPSNPDVVVPQTSDDTNLALMIGCVLGGFALAVAALVANAVCFRDRMPWVWLKKRGGKCEHSAK